jgi:hypothetical protein
MWADGGTTQTRLLSPLSTYPAHFHSILLLLPVLLLLLIQLLLLLNICNCCVLRCSQ